MPRLVIALVLTLCFVSHDVLCSILNGNRIGNEDGAGEEFEYEEQKVLSIVGGQQVVRGSYPWTASITMPGIGIRQCGATIVAPNWIITAGHCFSEYFRNSDFIVEIGGYEKSDPVEKIAIESVFVHDKFDNQNFTFSDIALVKLNHTITSHYEKLPFVSYELYEEIDNFNICKIIGWGASNKEERKNIFADSKFLREAEVPLMDVYECSKKFSPFQVDPNTHICAGGKGRGTCNGDSGGPLQCWHSKLKQWFLLGITSYGIPCGYQGYPDVYTSIPAFHEWIQDTLEQNM